MTTDQLRQAQRTIPFKPFSVCLADGRRLHVPRPEFLWIHPGGRRACVATSGSAADVVDLLLVVAIEIDTEAA
jgi:hypothetical protein